VLLGNAKLQNAECKEKERLWNGAHLGFDALCQTKAIVLHHVIGQPTPNGRKERHFKERWIHGNTPYTTKK